MNDGGVCRTAPATPGLLKKKKIKSLRKSMINFYLQIFVQAIKFGGE